jgi:hypothetical protein
MAIEMPEVNEAPAEEAWSTPPAIAAARGLLKPPVEQEGSIWALFGAFALLAGSAMALATAIVMGPPHF